MKKFLVLYEAPASAMAQMAKATPEQTKQGMDLWMKWKGANDKAIVDLGTPLGNGAHLKNESASKASSPVVGYSILQAESLDAAKKALKNHPHFQTQGGSIEVFEFLPIPGM